LAVHIPEEQPERWAFVSIAQYSKGGGERWVEPIIYLRRVRRVASSRHDTEGGTFYLAATYSSAGHPIVMWPTPLSADSRHRSSHREART
jgi:hypothetical protein